jgi:hypothetical protein
VPSIHKALTCTLIVLLIDCLLVSLMLTDYTLLIYKSLCTRAVRRKLRGNCGFKCC